MAKMDDYSLLRAFRKLEMFSNLDSEEARILLALGEARSYTPPAKLWSAGEHSNFFIVVLNGHLRAIKPDGQIFFELGPGEVMGVGDVFTGGQRALDIEVAETSTVLFFYYQKLRTLIGDNPLVYIKVLEAVVRLLRAELKERTGV